ncbi:MAG: TonB-dependent receptor [Bacteroidetes bacterium]|nr:TonB-dependent receptor [Bacteroidota bacterium]
MKNKLLIVIILTVQFTSVFSQESSIRGIVFDKFQKQPLEYANVTVKSQNDSLFISGCITNEKGFFKIESLPSGNYNLEISFIGYQAKRFENISLKGGEKDLGKIELSISAENLNAVTIIANKPSVIYKVDRKVIDAGNFPDANFAMDLLENVPSVQISIDGSKLAYRGDGVFKVFINGKAVTNGTERLREIPAKQIEKVEIITNPSAKYSAEGTAGIINVILKKTRLKGYAINSNLQIDTRGTYELLFSINKNGKKGGWYVNGQYAKYVWWKANVNQNQTVENFNSYQTTLLDSKQQSGGNMNNLTIGFNYDLTPKDEIDFSFFINPFNCTNEDSPITSVNERNFINNILQSEINYELSNVRYLSYRYYGPSFSYKHKFNKIGSKFISVNFDYFAYLNKLSEQSIDSKIYANSTIKQGYYNTEQNEKDIELSIDYENPIGDNYKIETGISLETNHIPKSTFENGYFNNKNNITPFANSVKYQQVHFARDVYSAYFTFKGKYNKFDYQFGLRGEHTRKVSDYTYISSTENTTSYDNAFTDIFPSFHTTYSFSETHQIAFSYSKRISRPQYYKLMPIKQYSDPYSYTIGNADLNPTYTNALELNYKKSWNKDFFSTELFARQTNNLMQYYTRVDTNGLMFLMPENIGSSQSIGSEIMGTYNIASWWISNLSVSLYSYQLSVDVDGLQYTNNQFKFDIKFNNTFNLPKSIKLKLNFSYYSPSISAQIETSDYYITKLAISKSFFKDHWKLLVFTNNILGNIKSNSIDKSKNYYIETNTEILQYLGFSISYSFNNQK